MQYIGLTLVWSLIVSLWYARSSSSGASALHDTPRLAVMMDALDRSNSYAMDN